MWKFLWSITSILSYAIIDKGVGVATLDLTKCYRLSTEKKVQVQRSNTTTLTLSMQGLDLPAVYDRLDDESGNVQIFRFTLICRCRNAFDTAEYLLQRIGLSEVGCTGSLKGGHPLYELGSDKVGVCFVASQQVVDDSAGSLTYSFLRVNSSIEMDRKDSSLDPSQAYYEEGNFMLDNLAYKDVCRFDN